MAYRLVFEVRQTIEFATWLDGLHDTVAQKAIGKRLARVEIGLLGDHASVGDRVSELRIHIGPGYRAYYTIRANVLVVLLCGGDKGSQDRDINRAKALEAQLE
jgi:putative addiction module killer protein